MNIENATDNILKDEQPEAEVTRRSALRNAGLLVGGALLGMGWSNKATAQNSGAMPTRGDILINPSEVGEPDSRARRDAVTAEGVAMARAVFGNLATPRNDIEILNFALLLEHLEADYYARAVEAHRQRPYLQPRAAELAQKLRDDENVHVVAVTQRIQELGGTPVAKPRFQFPAETFVSQTSFLDLAGTFEQNGVGAYLDAAPKLKRPEVLRFAASIYGVEARHTSMIRYVSGRLAAPSALETPLSALEVATRSTPFIISPAA